MLPHHPLPGDHRTVVNLPQLFRCRDAEPAREVRYVLPVGAAGTGALLARKPDLFLGNYRKGIEMGELAGSGCGNGAGGHA